MILTNCKRIAIATLAVATAIFIPVMASGWGDEGHMAINRVAASKLPADVPAFLKKSAPRISWLGPEPDRWRSNLEKPLNDAQAPDHFIDMEYVDWMDKLPPDRYRFVRAVYDYRKAHPEADIPTPEKIGFQPYIVIEVYDRLKVALRQYRHAVAEHKSTANAKADAIFYAGWLGHYTGDGANPMHTTIQYNGWVGPNPNGYTTSHDVHHKFESTFVIANPEVTNMADLVGQPVMLEHPFEDYIAYLKESRGLIEQTYQLEKTGAFNGRGTPEGREFVRKQFGRGAQMTLNMIYTAWIESAQEPEPFHAPAPEPEKKK